MKNKIDLDINLNRKTLYVKKTVAIVFCLMMVFSVFALGNKNKSESNTKEGQTEMQKTNTQDNSKKSKILVAYFSRADENYSVGFIKKGNTKIIAQMIATELKADLFEISRKEPYPAEYEKTTNEARKEQQNKARPTLSETLENIDDYDVVFLGYPIWWSDFPMPLYTFLESYDFSGKTIIPFCTHEGSGFSGTVQTLQQKLIKSKVLSGFAIKGSKAQNNQASAKEDVLKWLKALGYVN